MRAALEDALTMTDSFYGPIIKIDYDFKVFAEHLLDGLGRRGYVLREAEA